jgi:hypothetical protein
MRLPPSRNNFPLFSACNLVVLAFCLLGLALPSQAAASGSPRGGAHVSRTGSSYSVQLSWTASQSNDVVGYNIYRGRISGGPYRKLNQYLHSITVFNDYWLHDERTYYYVTTAVNSEGQESNYSNEAQAIIP